MSANWFYGLAEVNWTFGVFCAFGLERRPTNRRNANGAKMTAIFRAFCVSLLAKALRWLPQRKAEGKACYHLHEFWLTLWSSKDAPTNPRGIPYAPFVDKVEDYVASRAEVEATLKNFQEMISCVLDHRARFIHPGLSDGTENTSLWKWTPSEELRGLKIKYQISRKLWILFAFWKHGRFAILAEHI